MKVKLRAPANRTRFHSFSKLFFCSANK